MKCRPVGPQDADIMIVGEAPGVEEERRGEPFIGASGNELTRMLHEAGIIRSECYITNTVKVRPPNNEIAKFYLKNTPQSRIAGPELEAGISELRAEVERVNPRVIIALGDTALWALTGERGITKWRGSLLEYASGSTVVPVYHPAAILRRWDWRPVAVHDLRRARRHCDSPQGAPDYRFNVRPSFSQALDAIKGTADALTRGTLSRIAVDIETRNKHIACVGVATSTVDAFCIPLMCTENSEGYWTLDEETVIVSELCKLLTHPKAKIIGQNFLYDLQYFARYWGIAPIPWMDTMIAQGVCYPGMPKGLDFLSSMYCDYHRYWKDESKDWDPKLGEDQLWVYNCKDAVVTWEVAHVLEAVIDKLNLRRPFDFEMSLVEPLLHMMMRGVRIDKQRKDAMFWELQAAMQEREEFFEALDLTGGISLVKSKTAKPWYRSPTQQRKLFYEIYKLPGNINRKTRKATVDDEALTKIGQKEPLFLPITERMKEYRSLGVFLNTFVTTPTDHDGRLRCSYNPVGTETLRFNSSADAFGYGTNLQNIPNVKE